jgi:hypothetical protein
VIEACHVFLILSQSFSTPLYPSIVVRAKKRASIFCSFVVFNLGFTFESLKELGVCHLKSHYFNLLFRKSNTYVWLKDKEEIN